MGLGTTENEECIREGGNKRISFLKNVFTPSFNVHADSFRVNTVDPDFELNLASLSVSIRPLQILEIRGDEMLLVSFNCWREASFERSMKRCLLGLFLATWP